MNHLLRYTQECMTPAEPTEVILEGDVQEAVVQVNEAGEKVEDAEHQIRTANDAVNSLYVLASTIEESVRRGSTEAGAEVVPMDPAAQAAVEVALEQIYNSIGLSKPVSLSLEAGFLDNAKEGAAKIKDHAIRILTAIVEAFRKAMDWITDYLAEATGAANRLGKYAEQLRREVLKIRGNGQAQQAEFSNKPLAKALSKGQDLAKRLDNLLELVDDARRVAVGQHVTLMNEIIEDFAAAEKKDVDAMLKLVVRFPEVLNKTYDGVFAHGNELADVDPVFAPEGTEVYTTDYLPGGYLGVLVLPEALDTLRHLKFAIRRDDAAADEEAGDGVMKTLTRDQMDELLNIVITICEKIKGFQSAERKLREFSGKLTKSVEQLKKAPREMSQSDRELLGTVAIMAPYIAKGIHSRVFGFAVGSAGAVTKYVAQSLKQYAPAKA